MSRRRIVDNSSRPRDVTGRAQSFAVGIPLLAVAVSFAFAMPIHSRSAPGRGTLLLVSVLLELWFAFLWPLVCSILFRERYGFGTWRGFWLGLGGGFAFMVAQFFLVLPRFFFRDLDALLFLLIPMGWLGMVFVGVLGGIVSARKSNGDSHS